MKLSVIVPAYNEEKLIVSHMLEISEFLLKNSITYEILVVDDGSTDRTVLLLKSAKIRGVRVLQLTRNYGKGYAVRTGALEAKGDFLLLCDVDLSTPIRYVLDFLGKTSQFDIIIASRSLMNSQTQTRFHKKLLGRLSWLIIHIFIVKHIKDTQCGFKLFSRKTVPLLFEKQTIRRWGFDFELLFLAQKQGLRILEYPVTWVENTDSKVTLSDYPKTLLEIFKVRYADFRGRYK